ncbi:nucleotidyltransferase family protein [Thioflexithrix psekupsensis]|uniref:DNA polymerase beta subunit n=1 Tax=Thioflexithrix psekupsensis TaxID=1570016 RepID=A0A251X6R2_9GAMM|nr:nucleotidyltransferase domain-containing protein [Thioflexithrix psekupsensis]OUD13328.1 DNA polymerase beta subunit [Thioflexithrix psekupsensis]
MIHLDAKYLDEVRTILQQQVPEYEVWAFGSRVHQRGLKPFSDLDLVLITEQPIDSSLYGLLKEAFSESDLPIRVDIADWSLLSDSFKNIILQAYQKIQ